MENTPKIDLSSYGVKSPEEKEKDLAMEKELWEAVLSNPEDEEHHKAYTGHVLRSGLLKEGSRNYGKMMNDKENYSIDARRFAHFYQKQFVNVMFMTPRNSAHEKKGGGAGYFLTFVAMLLLLTAVFAPKFWYLGPFGLIYLAVYLSKKYLESKEKREKLRKIQ